MFSLNRYLTIKNSVLLYTVILSFVPFIYVDKSLAQSNSHTKIDASEVMSSSVIFDDHPEELGIPFFGKPDWKYVIDSAVLGPEGRFLYALKLGSLTKFQLSPFKYVSSFDIPVEDLEPMDYRKNHKLNRVFVTTNSKLVIYINNVIYPVKKTSKIIVVDLETKRVVKAINLPQDNNLKYVDAVLHEPYVFSIIHGSIPEKPGVSEVVVRQISDLTIVKKVQFNTRLSVMHHPIFKLGNSIVKLGSASTAEVGETVFLNPQTLSPEFQFSVLSEGNGEAYLSNDFKKLYVECAFFDQGTKCFPAEIDIGSKTMVRAEEDVKTNLKLLKANISFAGDFFLKGNQIPTLVDAKNDLVYTIYQYPDGETIIFNKETKQFLLTENARKHVQMTNKNNQLVPINDLTFKKFHKSTF